MNNTHIQKFNSERIIFLPLTTSNNLNEKQGQGYYLLPPRCIFNNDKLVLQSFDSAGNYPLYFLANLFNIRIAQRSFGS